MTVTLNLSDEVSQRLHALAQQKQQTPEAVAAELLSARIVQELDKPESTLSDEAFYTLAKGVIADNRELLERLAK